jgi:hypothetical protein
MMIDAVGNNHPGTDMRLAISFNQLGVAHLMNDGEFVTVCQSLAKKWSHADERKDRTKAEDCFKRAEFEIQRLTDYEAYKTSLPLVNRGACAHMDGRYDETEALLLRGLADRVAKFGLNDGESFM